MSHPRQAGPPGHRPPAATGTSPVVSVIMIFWNAEAFLAQAMDSVLSQTLADLELLLVDDGSRDGSTVLAENRAAADGRVRLLAHPGGRNQGTGRSRNLGLQAARGKYIAFLDADDVYEPERLARHVAVLESKPHIGSVISRECYWRQWAAVTADAHSRFPDYEVGPHAQPDTTIPEATLLFSILATPGAPMPGICSITFRQDMLASLGFIPESFVDQYEDQVLIAKLLLAAPTWLLDACLARYRQHADSLTHRARVTGAYCPGRPHRARDLYLEWLRRHLQQQGAWHAAWAAVLPRRGPSSASGPASVPDARATGGASPSGVAVSLRGAVLRLVALLPVAMARPLIHALWQLRDAHIRRRAIKAAQRLPAFQGGARQTEEHV